MIEGHDRDIVCYEDLGAFCCPCGARWVDGAEQLPFRDWVIFHVEHSSGWCRHEVKNDGRKVIGGPLGRRYIITQRKKATS